MQQAIAYRTENPEDRRQELAYRIEREIASTIQPPFGDMSRGLAQGLLSTVYDVAAEEPHPTRREAMEWFDKNYLQREIRHAKGNITQVVRNAFSVDDENEVNNLRRNVYRKIERYGLGEEVDLARPWKPKPLEQCVDENIYIPADRVEQTLSKSLAGYKDVINPVLYDGLSERIRDKSPALAEKISAYAPTPANRLKEIVQSTEGIRNYNQASQAFERQVIYDTLSATGWDKKKTAEYLGDSLRTLNRRIAELGIEEQARTGEQKQDNIVRIDEFVQRKLEPDKPAIAVNEIERFQQLVREYNAKRDVARENKEKKKKQVQWKAE
jgi:hypothetical protein